MLRGVWRLTEVVGHQRRGCDRGLRELLSPAALLLQILWENRNNEAGRKKKKQP